MSKDDPFTSSRRQAERNAFEFRGKMIRWGIVAALVLVAVGGWLLFK